MKKKSATRITLIIATLVLVSAGIIYLVGKIDKNKPLSEAQTKELLQEMSGNKWMASSTPEEREKFVDAQKESLDSMLVEGTSSTSTVEQEAFRQEQIRLLDALRNK
jgi:hypothetical protein